MIEFTFEEAYLFTFKEGYLFTFKEGYLFTFKEGYLFTFEEVPHMMVSTLTVYLTTFLASIHAGTLQSSPPCQSPV